MTLDDVSQDDSKPSPQPNILGLLDTLTESGEPEALLRGFSLRLGDGSHWWITGSRPTFFIAEKLAFIMQLKEGNPCEGNPKDDRLMYFYEKNADHHRLELLFSQDQSWISVRPPFQIHLHSNWHHTLCEYDAANPERTPYVLMFEAAPVIHRESIGRGGLPFHAALLEHRGQGVILAAPGETGKSTCSRRVVYPWQARCDDEVLVVLTPEGRYLAHPFPTWTDYLWERAENTWRVEDAVPLAGIFFFEQSLQDDFVPLEGAQAAVDATSSAEQTMTRLLRWCDPKDARGVRRTMFANACEIVKQVPTFRLQVSLYGRFWEKIETALGWQ